MFPYTSGKAKRDRNASALEYVKSTHKWQSCYKLVVGLLAAGTSPHSQEKIANWSRKPNYIRWMLFSSLGLSGVFSTSPSFQRVLIHFHAALNLGAGAEQAFHFLAVQNRQAMHSVESSMYWTVKINMVNGLFCATLASRRKNHIPLV